MAAAGLSPIAASSDPAFRGDPTRWNPEQLFVAALSQCHMLWYLNLAASAGVVVAAYEDRPTGVMIEDAGGGGEFHSITLNPVVTITAESDATLAEALHHRVGGLCFIARSVRTPLDYRITIAHEA